MIGIGKRSGSGRRSERRGEGALIVPAVALTNCDGLSGSLMELK